MKHAINIGLAGLFLILLAGCQSFTKEPVFPLSQYEPAKQGHGLVVNHAGPGRFFSGTEKIWLEECDYKIDRKEGEPFVVYPAYIYTNCKQQGAVQKH